MRFLGLMLLAAIGFTACLNTDDNQGQVYENTSWGAFINASPDSQGLKFLSDGYIISSNPTNYSQYFGYAPLQAGTRQLTVRSENEILDTLSLNMLENKRYSI